MSDGPVDDPSVAISELSRNVAQAVRRAEAGETITITRDGVPVATLRPFERSNRDALISLFSEHDPDPEFADAIEEARGTMWGGTPQ